MFRVLSKIWESFKEYIILVVLLITSLFLLSQNEKPAVNHVRAIAFGTFATATSVISGFINYPKMKSENEELRERNAELMLQISKLREYAIVEDDLLGMLSLKDTSKYSLIPSRIISKSLNRSQNTFTLNVGNKDSIKVGMPVITDKGLVGIINSVSENFSVLRTLHNRDLKLTVTNERSRVDGILKWNGSELSIVDVPKTFDHKKGDRIFTSELSSIISIPIPIGIVADFKNVETGIFNEIVVLPFTDLTKVEYVFIIPIVQSKVLNDVELNFYNR